ncbi:MAG: hypothetical protein QW056_01390 [Candidatus Bathyarchaeia archaeon]
MKARWIIIISLIATLFVALLLSSYSGDKEVAKNFYIGVTFCGNTFAESKLLIDRVKDYTNLFVVLSGPVSCNETALTEICEYAANAGLHLIVFFGDLDSRVLKIKNLEWRLSWIKMAKQKWGDQFLGVYYYDEPGGIFIDYKWSELEPFAQNLPRNLSYDMAANSYVNLFHMDNGFKFLEANCIDVFVSDYALYWFDYLAGYDVVLAQIGWNHTFARDIALVRGAATAQNKSWGIIITWKYRHPPYLDTAENIYMQMLDAYKCGAKYILIFNYADNMESPYGIMTEEHFEALKRFWNEVVKDPKVIHGSIKAEAAMVLPKNYGWGMRHPNDKIWGWWEPDEKSQQIWELACALLEKYGLHLDITYDDQNFPINSKYRNIYYWNHSPSST